MLPPALEWYQPGLAVEERLPWWASDGARARARRIALGLYAAGQLAWIAAALWTWIH